MDSILPESLSSNGLALIVASIIFIVTVILVSKQLINFTITLVLLFFAIVSGFAVANNDIVRSYLMGTPAADTKAVAEAKSSFDERIGIIQTNLREIFDQLVELLSNQPEAGAKPPQDAEKAQRLRASIENTLEVLEHHRPLLKQLLDSKEENER